MSILAGRLYLASALLATTGCVIWAVAVAGTGAVGIPLGLAVVSAVLLVSGLLLFPRFVEAWIEGDAVIVRRIFGRRVVRIADVQEVVVLHGLMLPSRVAGPLTRRVLLRGQTAVLEAFSTATDAVTDELRGRGERVVEVRQPLGPSVARRRFPGSVSLVETVLGPVLAVIVVAVLGITAAIVLG